MNGVRQADGEWIYADPTSTIEYVGGSSPGTDTLVAGVYDYTTNSYSYSNSISLTTTSASPSQLTNDVASAEALIAQQVENGQAPNKFNSSYYLLTDDPALVDQIANDIDPNGLNRDYTIDNGYIDPIGTPGDQQCAVLVQALFPHTSTTTGVGGTGHWRNGSEQIVINGGENPALVGVTGIPIATFVDQAGDPVATLAPGQGVYPDRTPKAGEPEHAAIFLGYDTEDRHGVLQQGFLVLDQHTDYPAEIRFIQFTGPNKDPYATEYYNIVYAKS